MSEGAARIVLRSAVVYAPRFPHSTSLIVDSGRLAWIGDETGLTGQLVDSDVIIDCGERLITPGFFDAALDEGRTLGAAFVGAIERRADGRLLVVRSPNSGALPTRLPNSAVPELVVPANSKESADDLVGQAQDFRAMCVLAGGDPSGVAAALARAGVPIAFGSSGASSGSPWEWIREAVFRVGGISARAGFNAVTRAGWRLAGLPELGDFAPGSQAHLNIWDCAGLDVQAPDDRVSRWSTDSRSGTSPLPDLRPNVELPILWASMNGDDLRRTAT